MPGFCNFGVFFGVFLGFEFQKNGFQARACGFIDVYAWRFESSKELGILLLYYACYRPKQSVDAQISSKMVFLESLKSVTFLG